MRYYVAMNSYCTETSDGFANTWFFVAFGTRQERAQAIKEGILAARPLTRDEYRFTKNVQEIHTLDNFKNAIRRL